jgi:hypothetical protein
MNATLLVPRYSGRRASSVRPPGKRPHRRRRPGLLATAAAVLAVGAAGLAHAQPERTGSTGAQLTAGGTSVASDEAERRGLVFVTTWRPDGSGVSCSGVLIANDLALTAGHCIDHLTGSNTIVTPAFDTTVTVGVDAIYKFGGWASDPTGPDIGLLHLVLPVAVNGSTTGFAIPLFRGNPEGRTVTVYGASTGVYLKADMEVPNLFGRNFVLSRTAAGVTTDHGDSGGPAFVVDGATAFLAGVTSTTGAPNALSASVAAHVAWIEAAVAVPLSQYEPLQIGVAQEGELRAVPEGDRLAAGGDPLAGVGWSRAQRVAQWLCTKRGFVGGTFLPGPVNGAEQHRFACIGRDGGVFRNATTAEVDGTGAGFGSIDGVPWAQAARAADAVCRTVLPGSIGGFFTGFGDTMLELGQVCLFAETGARYAAHGPGPDAFDWRVARREADAFCRRVGRLGGFPTGAPAGSGREIVCLGPFGIELALAPIIDLVMTGEDRPVATEFLLPVLSVLYQ